MLLFDRSLLRWLQKNQVLEELFGNRRHNQLIKKSGDVISYLATHAGLTEEHIQVIWRCAIEAHEAFTIEVMKILGDCAPSFQNNHIEQLLNYLSQIPKHALTDIYLTLLKDLCRGCQDSELRVMCYFLSNQLTTSMILIIFKHYHHHRTNCWIHYGK